MSTNQASPRARRDRLGSAAAAAAPGGFVGAAGARLVIVSGPSGVGKDTVIAALRRRAGGSDFHYVVTCTTRPPRPYEVDGVHYHFVSDAAFERLVEAGELL